MHTIDRTIGSHRSRNTPKSCCTSSQTDFFAFHCTIILRNAQFINTRIPPHFLADINADAYQISKKHDSEYAISQFLPAGIKSQCKHHCHRDNQDGPAFRHIGKISRVFQRMRGVYTKITTTICTQLFNWNNRSRRTLGNHLLLTFKSRDFHLAVKSHRSPLENQDKTYNQRKRQ